MRKLIFLLLSLTLCFSSCSKQEDEVGGETPAPPFTSEALPSDNSHADFIATTKDGKTLYFKITSPSTCEVTYNGDYSATENYVVGSLSVPSHVNYQGEKLEVTGIGKKAFYRCKNLGGVLLPTTIKKIGDNAFDECENLSSINIPDAVIEIGQDAFSDTGLASISFPNGIKNVSLSGCSKLSSLRLPDNLERLYLSECAFIPSLSIPEGVKSIYLFSCEGLETINIPQGVTELFLKRCSGINHHIEIPNGVETISEDAFSNCRSLPSVTIPDKIRYIGKGAFVYCIYEA